MPDRIVVVLEDVAGASSLRDLLSREGFDVLVDSPLPVGNYKATIKLAEEPDGTCSMAWSSDFEAVGAPENQAIEAIQGVYQAGFDNLKKMFGG